MGSGSRYNGPKAGREEGRERGVGGRGVGRQVDG